MDRDYAWRFTPPDETLRVHMNVLAHGERDFDATLVLERRADHRRESRARAAALSGDVGARGRGDPLAGVLDLS